MAIHHTASVLLIIAFAAAFGMQWLLMRRMGRSLEQSQRVRAMEYTDSTTAQQETPDSAQREQQ
ncbi:hypothetical protein [Alicyclobacillus sp. SO9]|uniref:hypothetical protein n=1 Tax=Alicyclobacillus sp. SO9 TaxID=2665646 RepID=UPI0018E71935|nr:hypothetical protein [Alicyclobacillus sp. SO9]QQE77394.1 hypothetical protein GI364_15720 [Alicyclobacillus sp. SO9]